MNSTMNRKILIKVFLSYNNFQGILDEKVLPKDKKLREEAEERILKEKSEAINK